jgi:hypothetical protein
VVLAADALMQASPAHALFWDHDAVLPVLIDATEPAVDRD